VTYAQAAGEAVKLKIDSPTYLKSMQTEPIPPLLDILASCLLKSLLSPLTQLAEPLTPITCSHPSTNNSTRGYTTLNAQLASLEVDLS